MSFFFGIFLMAWVVWTVLFSIVAIHKMNNGEKYECVFDCMLNAVIIAAIFSLLITATRFGWTLVFNN